jgi:hypothetical protein
MLNGNWRPSGAQTHEPVTMLDHDRLNLGIGQEFEELGTTSVSESVNAYFHNSPASTLVMISLAMGSFYGKTVVTMASLTVRTIRAPG